MCDLMQFVLSSITFDTTFANLAYLFMFDVVLIFGILLVVLIDDGGFSK